jgi:hypothetical protein
MRIAAHPVRPERTPEGGAASDLGGVAVETLQAKCSDVFVPLDASECRTEHLAADNPVVGTNEGARPHRWVTGFSQNRRIDLTRI